MPNVDLPTPSSDYTIPHSSDYRLILFWCAMRKIIFPIFAVLSLTTGCAWTTATPIDPHDVERPNLFGGFVYYECKPLVALSGSSITILYVKNMSRPYAVRFGAFLAKNDVKLAFDKDCGITKVESNIDTTGIIELLQSALDKALPDAKPAGGTAASGSIAQLYDIIFDEDGNIMRLRPLINPDTSRLVAVPGDT
jgi:hypothetical protein